MFATSSTDPYRLLDLDRRSTQGLCEPHLEVRLYLVQGSLFFEFDEGGYTYYGAASAVKGHHVRIADTGETLPLETRPFTPIFPYAPESWWKKAFGAIAVGKFHWRPRPGDGRAWSEHWFIAGVLLSPITASAVLFLSILWVANPKRG
jgi:hypothetical protein